MRRQLRLILVALLLAGFAGAGLADYEPSASSSYTVQPGDSLWAIAQSHHLTVAELAAANGLDPQGILLIGVHLRIPPPPGAEPAETAAPAVNPWTFCSTFVPARAPWGVPPALLAASPGRLALRPLMQHWAAHYGLSLPLLEAIAWQESGWQQGVVSSAGAVGVGQIMPGTAGFIQTYLVGQPLNINSTSDNIRMAAAFLAYLAHIEGNSRCATIAAYYEGPLNLGARGVFPDTATYVASVEALIPRFS